MIIKRSLKYKMVSKRRYKKMNKQFNHITIEGRVGQEPEQKGSLVIFTLANNRQFKNANGEKEQKTTWVKCIAAGKQADYIKSYVHKGSALMLEGHLQNNNWTDAKGIKHSEIQVVVDKIEIMNSVKRDKAETNAAPELNQDKEMKQSQVPNQEQEMQQSTGMHR